MRSDFTFALTFLAIAVACPWLAARRAELPFVMWPAVAFLTVSLAYFTGRVELFGKRSDGSRHWLATLILLPYLVLARVVWRLQLAFSREPAADVVNDQLIVSRRLRRHELPADVSLICDLTSEFLDPRSIREAPGYFCFPILDASVPRPQDLARCLSQLRPAAGTRVLIHCAKGHGRTGLVAAAWLLATGTVTSIDQALALLHQARPGLSLNQQQRKFLVEIQSMYHNPAKPTSGADGAGESDANKL